MSQPQTAEVVIIFQSTADALFAESLFVREQMSGRLVPAPRHLSHGCGLAWKADESCSSVLRQVLDEHGIDAQIHALS